MLDTMAFQAVMFGGPVDGLRLPLDRGTVDFADPGGIVRYVDTRRFDRQGCKIYRFATPANNPIPNGRPDPRH